MPTYSTTLFLRHLERQATLFLETAVSSWQMIPHREFAHKPSAHSWSANECILTAMHVIIYPQLKKR
jgi:hypothetical protein